MPFVRILLFVFIQLLFAFRCSYGQSEIYNINYTLDQGLPTNNLYWVLQGDNGCLWLGSDIGLIRFNGVDFKVYTNEDARNNSISGMYVDEQNRIWCNNFANQLFCFKDDSLHLIKVWEETVVGELPLSEIYIIDDHRYYLSLQNGLTYIYDEQENTIEQDTIIDFIRRGIVPPLWDGENKRIMFYNDYVYYYTGNQVTKITHPQLPKSNKKLRYLNFWLEKGDIGPYLYLKSSTNFKLDKESIFFFKIEEDTMIPLPFTEQLKEALYGERLIKTHWQNDSVVWLATSNGIFSWDIYKNQSQHYLKDLFCTDLTIDKEHNIWATSISQGLFFLPSTDVIQYPIKSKVRMCRDDLGNLLLIYDNNRLRYIDAQSQEVIFEDTLESKRTVELVRYNPYKKQFIIVQTGEFLSYFDPYTQKQIKSSYPFTAAKEIYFDHYQNVYIVEGHGVIGLGVEGDNNYLKGAYWLRQKIDTVSSYSTEVNKRINRKRFHFGPGYLHPLKMLRFNDQLVRTYSMAMLDTREELFFWTANANGMYYIRNTHPVDIKNQKGGILIARSLLAMKDTSVWVATSNQGLIRVKEDRVIETINQTKGMPSNKLYCLDRDGDFIWAGTQKGLVRYNMKTQELIHWNPLKGMKSNKVNKVKVVGDQVYFVMNAKLFQASKYNPSELRAYLPIRILKLVVNEVEQDLDEDLVLSYSDNSIEVSFEGINLRSQGMFKYYYRLRNSEKKWIQTTAYNRTIRYPNLPAGRYTFEVKVVDCFGNESIKPAQIAFCILAPFHQTWTFYMLCFLLGGGLFLCGILLLKRKEQIRLSKKEEEARRELVQTQLERDLRIAQLKALKAQMNPHFIFNVLNSIQALFLINDKLTGNLLLNEFSQLIRLTLDMSEDLEVSLEDELHLLHLYLNVEYIRTKKRFNYQIHVDEELEDYEIYLPSLLIQPYVENALKHGLMHQEGEQNLQIEFKLREGDVLEIIIDDNGIGREASKAQRIKGHKSFSTFANHKRLKLFNVDVDNKIELNIIDKVNSNSLPGGTRIEIKIPIVN